MEWDKYSLPACLNPRRIAFGHLHFSPLENYVRSWLDLLPQADSSFEFGCGFGLNLCYLAKCGKVRRGVGIDISSGALKGAAMLSKALEVDHLCEFTEMDYADFTPKDAYQIVLCIQFINYVVDLDSFFEVLSRMTNMSSTILIHDAQRNPFSMYSALANNKFARRLLRKGRLSSPDGGLIYFKATTIREKANEHGFSVTSEFYAMPFFLGPILEILYYLSLSEFANDKLRLLVKRIYRAINKFAAVLSKRLSSRENSVWYCITLRKKQAQDG